MPPFMQDGAGSMQWTDMFLCKQSIISFVLIIYFYLLADGRKLVLWVSIPETYNVIVFFIWLKCINNRNLFITWRSAIWVLFIYWLRRHWQRSWLCNMQSIVCVRVVRPEGNVNLHMIFILFADIGHADANRLCMTAGDLAGDYYTFS